MVEGARHYSETMSASTSSELEPVLAKMTKCQTLEDYEDGWPCVTFAYFMKCEIMIQRVVKFLQQYTNISISRIIKGGSFGRGTFPYYQTDIELYIFLNDLTCSSMEKLKTKTGDFLITFKALLQSPLWQYGTVQLQNSTDPHSIRFRLMCPDLGQQHTIDILPAIDILQYKSIPEVYQQMMSISEDDQGYYSVCLGPKQIEFFTEAPSELRQLMRLLKHWSATELSAMIRVASSYFIEVLVMHRWHQAGKPDTCSFSEWFEEIVSQLADLPSLFIIWKDRYNAAGYRILPPSPVVLDPVNPFKNLIPPPEYHELIMKQAKAVLHRMKKLREHLRLGPPSVLTDMRKGQTLHQFIAETIQPDSESRRNCDEIVERVTCFLQHYTKFSVSMVIKGGSLGKSTNISGKSDVDLVVFINELTSAKDLQIYMKFLLTSLKNDLATKWPVFAGYLQLERETCHGLQYKLSCSNGGHVHDVDILPACNILQGKTFEEVFEEMSRKTPQEREYYSACFTQKQVEFVKQVPVKVKNLIRLFKYWAKTELNTECRIVSSYFLESLVMYNWTESNRPEDFNTDDWFKTIMIQLAKLNSMSILWPKHYQADLYYNIDQIYPRKPILLDPLNPFRNLAPLEKYLGVVMERATVVIHKIEDLCNYRNGNCLNK